MNAERPAYRYLEPPDGAPSRIGQGIRWGLMFGAVAWFLILAAGFLIARAA